MNAGLLSDKKKKIYKDKKIKEAEEWITMYYEHAVAGTTPDSFETYRISRGLPRTTPSSGASAPKSRISLVGVLLLVSCWRSYVHWNKSRINQTWSVHRHHKTAATDAPAACRYANVAPVDSCHNLKLRAALCDTFTRESTGSFSAVDACKSMTHSGLYRDKFLT